MKKRGITAVVDFLLSAVSIPILLVAVALFVYTVVRNYQYNRAMMVESQENVLESIESHVSAIREGTMDTVQSMEFLYFTNTSESGHISGHGVKVLESAQRDLSKYPEVDGVLLYSDKTQRFYDCYFKTDSGNMDELLTPFMIPTRNRRETELRVVSAGPDDTDLYLIYIVRQRYGSIAVLIDPDKNEGYRTLCSISEGELTFHSVGTEVKSWRLVSSDSETLPLGLSHRASGVRSFTGQNMFQLIAVLVLIGLFVMILVLFRFTHRTLLMPLLQLSDAFRQITDGNTSYRIGKRSRIAEIDQFYTGFDGMLDSLQAAQQEKYRHEMDAVQAKMQYLQLQIRPHFYLNCLKTIHFLAQIHEDEKIQTIAVTLSQYFRNSFRDVNSLVPIREEVESAVNYVELCRCLFGEIRLEVTVPEEAMELRCLPMTVLTFVENSVKHRQDDDVTAIRIAAELEETGDGPQVRLTVQNNSRFSQEVLTELGEASASEFHYKSRRVGIANVRYRMWLLYGERCAQSFSNEDGMATVTLTFPAERYDPAERKLQ